MKRLVYPVLMLRPPRNEIAAVGSWGGVVTDLESILGGNRSGLQKSLTCVFCVVHQCDNILAAYELTEAI